MLNFIFNLFKDKTRDFPIEQDTSAAIIRQLLVKFDETKVRELMALVGTSDYKAVADIVEDFGDNFRNSSETQGLEVTAVSTTFFLLNSRIGLPKGWSALYKT